MLNLKFAEWCSNQHINTNHKYDGKPYSVHLDMVATVATRFETISPIDFTIIQHACYSHDLIEDCRITYRDLYRICISIFHDKQITKNICEITRAVTNYTRGRNRNERMPIHIYEDIRNTPGATFIKLCDRIANVEYSVSTESSMAQKYKNENFHFQHMLYEKCYESMFDHLVDLFNGKITK